MKKHDLYRHLGRNILFAFILLTISLCIGILGYHYFEKLAWIDAFVNAAMILSGMGPAEPLHTFPGKLFAGLYALYSGITFLIAIGAILAPLLQWFYHKLHMETKDK